MRGGHISCDEIATVAGVHPAAADLRGPDALGTAGAMSLVAEISACQLCAERFAATATAHSPRPVVWFQPGNAPRLMVAGQAPGARVHQSGRPFTDPSGLRLRDWMGLAEAEFYDRDKIAIVPMAFCFPGYNDKGADLPPPPVCARTWRSRVMASLGPVPLTLLVGGAAIRWHLGTPRMTDAVLQWRKWSAQGVFPLPHPSWRTTAWQRRNPWFEADLLPELRRAVRAVLHRDGGLNG